MTRSRVLLGSLFVVLGALFLADQASALDAGRVLSRWWPVAIVVLGVAKVVTRPRSPVGGPVLGAIGALLLLWTLGIVDTLGFVWPVLLIVLGLWLVIRRPGHERRGVADDDVTVVFGERRARAPAGELRIGEVTAVFGDVDLDLRDTRIDGEESLEIVCVFGDVDLEVPPEWNVTVRGPEVFGDVEVHTTSGLPPDAATLHLEVVAVFGDVSVRATPAARVEERAS